MKVKIEIKMYWKNVMEFKIELIHFAALIFILKTIFMKSKFDFQFQSIIFQFQTCNGLNNDDYSIAIKCQVFADLGEDLELWENGLRNSIKT